MGAKPTITMMAVLLALLSCSPSTGDDQRTEPHSEREAIRPSLADSQAESLPPVIDSYPNYRVAVSASGSFTARESNETMVLLVDPAQLFDRDRDHAIHRALWIPEMTNGDSHAMLRLRTLGYTRDELSMLTPFIESLGSSHPVFGFADLTGNGRDELLFLSTHGMGTSLLILTVTDGEFVYLMRGTADIDTILSMQRLSGPGELPIEFRLEGILYNADTESPWRWAEYGWDEEAGEFVVSGAGVLNEEPGD